MGDISARSWFQAGRGDSDDLWGKLIADRIADASVEVTARLAETTITVADLRNLEAGDLIMTDKLATSPVAVYVEAVPKFLGSIGQHRGYRAVRIQRSIKPGDRI